MQILIIFPSLSPGVCSKLVATLQKLDLLQKSFTVSPRAVDPVASQMCWWKVAALRVERSRCAPSTMHCCLSELTVALLLVAAAVGWTLAGLHPGRLLCVSHGLEQDIQHYKRVSVFKSGTQKLDSGKNLLCLIILRYLCFYDMLICLSVYVHSPMCKLRVKFGIHAISDILTPHLVCADHEYVLHICRCSIFY